MTCGIAHHPDLLLRLEVRDRTCEGHGIGHCQIEVCHLEIKVHHGALLARDQTGGT